MSFRPQRRRLLRLLSLAPLASLPLLRRAHAQDRVSESDPLAQELGYRHDATTVDTSKYPKRAGPEGANQFCRTCQFFHGGPNDTWASCTVFGGRQVNADGWCKSWFKRAG